MGKDNNAANNQFVGSGRYWTVNTATTASGVNLVEGTDNGTSFLTIKAPDSLLQEFKHIPSPQPQLILIFLKRMQMVF